MQSQSSSPTGVVLDDETDEPGSTPRMSFTASVAVVSIDDCRSGVCDPKWTSATRVVLSGADGRRWSLYAYFSGLPADFVDVGETLDLRVVFRELLTTLSGFAFWTTVLSRAGTAVVFDASDADDLTAYGITVTLSGEGCPSTCYTTYGANVTYGTETRSTGQGQPVMIGKLSFWGGFSVPVPNRTCGDNQLHTERMLGFTVR